LKQWSILAKKEGAQKDAWVDKLKEGISSGAFWQRRKEPRRTRGWTS
jgi:hypothetical protein